MIGNRYAKHLGGDDGREGLGEIGNHIQPAAATIENPVDQVLRDLMNVNAQ